MLSGTVKKLSVGCKYPRLLHALYTSAPLHWVCWVPQVLGPLEQQIPHRVWDCTCGFFPLICRVAVLTSNQVAVCSRGLCSVYVILHLLVFDVYRNELGHLQLWPLGWTVLPWATPRVDRSLPGDT